MRSKTQLDVHEIHEWYKKFYKDFPSGVVQSEDFHRIYKEMFPDGDPTEYAKHAFRTYDTDGNGQVDFTEFMITLGVMSKGTTEEKLHYAFRLYDIDGNGVVTRDEASRVISVSPPPPWRTRCWSCVGSMAGHLLRRWPAIDPAQGQSPVFVGWPDTDKLFRCLNYKGLWCSNLMFSVSWNQFTVNWHLERFQRNYC